MGSKLEIAGKIDANRFKGKMKICLEIQQFLGAAVWHTDINF